MTLPDKYTRPAVILHWVIAGLIIVNVGLIWSVDSLADDWIRPVINLHKSIGLSVLGFAVMRILWRVTHAPPPPPPGQAKWERTASHLAHFALYVIIVGLPLTGWMHDSAWKNAAGNPLTLFGLVEVPRMAWITAIEPGSREALHDVFGDWHDWFGKALITLFILHVAGALKHQWFDRQRELQRMTL